MYTLLAIAHKNKPIQLTITSDIEKRKEAWESVNQRYNILKDLKCLNRDRTMAKMHYLELAHADSYEDLVKIKLVIDYVNIRDRGLDVSRLVAFVDEELVVETDDLHAYLRDNPIKDSTLVSSTHTIKEYFGRVFG